jgi:hypothetical protein
MDEFFLSAELKAHLIPGRYVIDAYAMDPADTRESWSSGGVSLQVIGDQSRFGRAHLGGTLDVVPAEAGSIAAALRSE